MQVQVIHRLSAVFASVHYNTISISETSLPRNLGGYAKKMTQQFLLVIARVTQRCNVLARNDQKMDRGLGVDVRECKGVFVLVHRF